MKSKLSFNNIKYIDKTLLICVLALALLGLIFLYSASSYSALQEHGDSFYYVKKQAVGLAVGIVGMFFASVISDNIFKKLALPLFIFSLVLLGLVFVPVIGIENYGARRWIGIGGFSFQPSEIAKFAFVLFCAHYISREKVNTSRFLHNLPVAGAGLITCFLIIIEPNMSITVCVALVMVVMLFIGGMRIKHFLLCLLPVVAAVPVLILMKPYRIQRLLAFLDPFASPKEEGYQLVQSLYALGSGGWLGVGIGNSRQKYLFLPFAESDFIFSVVGEETGLVGCALIMAIFLILIIKGIKIALNSPSRFHCLLASGITAVIAIQTLVNLAVVTGSIPPTGLPLPFISYGGTSLVVFMTAAGVLLNISARQKSGLT